MPSPDSQAVVDGVLLRVSPSQVESFDAASNPETSCQRRWYFSKVLRLPQPEAGKGAAIGTAGHARIEHLLKTGEDVLGPLELAIRHVIPKPGPLIEVEKAISFTLPSGVQMSGRIDVLNRTGTWTDNEGWEHAMPGPEVIDWKFTSSIEHRAETPKSLGEDKAMLTYGYAVREPWVRLSHVYSQYKGAKKGLKVSTILQGNEVAERFHDTILPVVASMAKVAEIKDVQDVPPNFGACQAYRQPCPYLEKCQTNPLQRLVRLTTSTKTPPGETPMSLLSKMLSSTPSLPISTEPSIEPSQEQGSVLLSTRLSLEAEPFAGVNPPDAALNSSSLSLPQLKLSQPSTESSQATTGATTEDTSLPIKRGRGRPRKNPNLSPLAQQAAKSESAPTDSTAEIPSATAANPASLANPEKAATPKEPPATVVTKIASAKKMPIATAENLASSASATTTTTPIKAQSSVSDSKEGLWIYRNAVPSTPATPIEPYINDLASGLAKVSGGDDIRCSTNAKLTFGQWRGALAQAIRENPPGGGCWTLLARGELYDVAAEALIELSDLSVRGVL